MGATAVAEASTAVRNADSVASQRSSRRPSRDATEMAAEVAAVRAGLESSNIGATGATSSSSREPLSEPGRSSRPPSGLGLRPSHSGVSLAENSVSPGGGDALHTTIRFQNARIIALQDELDKTIAELA